MATVQKTMINIKTTTALKKEAMQTAEELGIPLSIAVNNFLKEFVREKRITLSNGHYPNAQTRKILDQAIKDVNEGKGMKTFESVEEADTYLMSL